MGGVTMPWGVQYPVNFSPSGDTTSQAFQKHIQEIKKIYDYLNTLNSSKLDASSLSSSLSGINSNLTTHINDSNPHPNYKPSVSFADLTGSLSLSDSRLTGTLPASKIASLTVSKLSDFASQVDSRITSKLSTFGGGDGIIDSGIVTGSTTRPPISGYIKFKNDFIIQWGGLIVSPAMFNSKREGDTYNYSVPFYVPFSSNCYAITVGTEIDTSDNEHAEVVFQVKNVTKTGCDFVPQVFYGSTDGFKNWNRIYGYYIAIGK